MKGAFLALLLLLTACTQPKAPAARAAYVPLTEIEATYGRLITAGNHPTPDQNGTGDRVGFFLHPDGDIWGLPLAIEANGRILGCAPPNLKDAPVTDTLESKATILGATNAPTGWRGGTGQLELLLKTATSTEWRPIKGGQITNGSVCWAQELPGPPQRLEYYRIKNGN